MKIKIRKAIKSLKPYQPGKPIEELERELKIPANKIIKLASNENPIGPSKMALKAIKSNIGKISRYPDGGCFYLKEKIAKKFSLKSDNILIGNGSDEIIDIITKTFLEEYDNAIVSDPAFLEYKLVTKARGAKVKSVPMKASLSSDKIGAFKYDIDKILKAIDKNTKLIFIGNPDNPTGAYLKRSEISSFLRRCPKRVVIVFDEAYSELISKKDYIDTTSLIKKGNVIVLRTFSKAYGLAGLRIGYAVTSKDIASWMERVRQPFNVNMVAQVGAIAALDDKEHVNNVRRLTDQGRSFVVKNLKALGFDVVETIANFVLFSYKNRTGVYFFEKLLPFGVIVRDMSVYGLNEWARVSIGTMIENKKFINTLKEIVE